MMSLLIRLLPSESCAAWRSRLYYVKALSRIAPSCFAELCAARPPLGWCTTTVRATSASAATLCACRSKSKTFATHESAVKCQNWRSAGACR